MQEKESIMVVWCGYKFPSLGITVCHHSAKPCDANSDPRTYFSIHIICIPDKNLCVTDQVNSTADTKLPEGATGKVLLTIRVIYQAKVNSL